MPMSNPFRRGKKEPRRSLASNASSEKLDNASKQQSQKPSPSPIPKQSTGTEPVAKKQQIQFRAQV